MMMKTRVNYEVRAEVAPESQLITTGLGDRANFRTLLDAELERLKERLLAVELARTTDLRANVLLRRAANEAVALVWLTPYPLLLLPSLFEEKARLARRSVGRQALIRERSSELLALAE